MNSLYNKIINEVYLVQDFDSWDKSGDTFKQDIKKSLSGLLFYDWDKPEREDYRKIKYEWFYNLKFENTYETIRPFYDWAFDNFNSHYCQNPITFGEGVTPKDPYYEDDITDLPKEYLESLKIWYDNQNKEKQEDVNNYTDFISAIKYQNIIDDSFQTITNLKDFFLNNGYRQTHVTEDFTFNFGQYRQGSRWKVLKYYMINKKDPKRIVRIIEVPDFNYTSSIDHKTHYGVYTVQFLFIESEKWIPEYYIN